MPGAPGNGQPAAAGADAGAVAGTDGRELDPQRVAQRLIEQRRQENAGWFMTHLRRAEHGALLFLASLWPGVGERHIAARDAEEREQRRREEAAEAERVAAEEAARAAAEGGAEGATEEGAEADGSGNPGQSDMATDGGGSSRGELPETRSEVGEESIERDAHGQSSGVEVHERREQPLVNA